MVRISAGRPWRLASGKRMFAASSTVFGYALRFGFTRALRFLNVDMVDKCVFEIRVSRGGGRKDAYFDLLAQIYQQTDPELGF